MFLEEAVKVRKGLYERRGKEEVEEVQILLRFDFLLGIHLDIVWRFGLEACFESV